jgi:hypothetical protein
MEGDPKIICAPVGVDDSGAVWGPEVREDSGAVGGSEIRGESVGGDDSWSVGSAEISAELSTGSSVWVPESSIALYKSLQRKLHITLQLSHCNYEGFYILVVRQMHTFIHC